MDEDGVPLRPRPRPPLRRVLAVLAVACAAPFTGFGAAPAAAASVLSLNPTTIRPGFSVEIRATCGENANPAVVHSGAFGSVTLVPSNGVLRTDVTIPSDTIAGVYTVFLECASGQRDSTQLTVIDGSGRRPNPDIGPQTGGGEMSGSVAMRTLYGGLAAALVGGIIWIVAALLARRRSRT
ncbi:MAG TPA: hypothetical protein VKB69_14480 [Micromonosporaceae bacterium]|nr:hypothetical protein [Micromonosporaceae bacterium]